MPALQPEPIPGTLAEPAEAFAVVPSMAVASHPLVRESAAASQSAAQQKRAVHLEYLPRLDLVAAFWVRGSGLLGSPAAGLRSRYSQLGCGRGVHVVDFRHSEIQARSRVAAANEVAAGARRDGVILAVSSQLATASAILEGTRRVAENTPTALASARAAELQARARYQSGLTSVVDVADAQRILAQAEVEDVLARLEVRRALLLLARSAGNLGPFMRAMKSSRPGGQ